VISSAFWLRQFHGDSSVVGRTIHLEGAPFTILGVTPSEFMGLGVVAEPDVTIPLTAVPLVNSHRPIASIKTSSSQWVHIIGRLKPAVTLQQARAHFDALGPGVLAASVPTGFSLAQRADFLSMHFSVASAATGVEPGLRSEYVTPLAIVLAIAGLVLLIACVNLASLMLARAAARRHEIAVRLALGASPWRVARQVLTEGLLLSLAGGACGLLFAFWGCHAITTLIFEEYLVPVFFDGTPDLRVTGITTAIALAVGALFSLAPMWCVWRERSTAALQQNSQTMTGTGHVGRLLVAAQVALSLVLLANAGLLVRSLSEVRSIESGISRTDGVFVAYPGPVPGGYDHLDSDVYYQEVLQRISALPGVSRASASLLKPATSGTPPLALVAPVAEQSLLDRGVQSTLTPVSPGFFDVVGIQLLKGRDFSWHDGSRGRRVAILSRSLTERLFGKSDPIGQRIRVGLTAERQDVEVIGVVSDARLW
jgi:predicted permease